MIVLPRFIQCRPMLVKDYEKIIVTDTFLQTIAKNTPQDEPSTCLPPIMSTIFHAVRCGSTTSALIDI